MSEENPPEAPPEAPEAGLPYVPKPPLDDESFPEEEPPESPISNGEIPTGLARRTIRYLIDDRWKEVYNNPWLLTDRTHRMDQSDIFYPMRTMLYRLGYNVDSLSEEETRTKLYSYIKEYCEKREIKRHEIGIFAADRAVLAYSGELYSVSFENYKDLAWLGADIVCIEKEGIVEKEAPFTEGVGIGLLQSQGFVSEYGVMLAKEAKRNFANVAGITDCDADGIKIAFHLEGITRIGIDFDTIEEINAQIRSELEGNTFGPRAPPAAANHDKCAYIPDMEDLDPPFGEIEELDIDELVEKRREGDNWKSLEYLTKGLKRKSISNHKLVPIEGTLREKRYIRYLNEKHIYKGQEITNLEFLRENRIELNTIMTQIGAKRFWNWIYFKMLEQYPTRNYSRVISLPPYEIRIPALEKLNLLVNSQIVNCTEDEIETIRKELKRVPGLLDVELKTDDINDRLNDLVNEDKDLSKVNKGLEKLIDRYFSNKEK